MFSEECFTLLVLHSPYVITSQVLTRCHFISREEASVDLKLLLLCLLSNACVYTSLCTHITLCIAAGTSELYSRKYSDMCINFVLFSSCQLSMLINTHCITKFQLQTVNWLFIILTTGPGIPISTLFENRGDRGTASILPISEQLLPLPLIQIKFF